MTSLSNNIDWKSSMIVSFSLPAVTKWFDCCDLAHTFSLYQRLKKSFSKIISVPEVWMKNKAL